MRGEVNPMILILNQDPLFLLPASPPAPSEKIDGGKKVIWGRKSRERRREASMQNSSFGT